MPLLSTPPRYFAAMIALPRFATTLPLIAAAAALFSPAAIFAHHGADVAVC